MKILFITKDFFPNTGGIAVFLHNLCQQLSLRGHKVDLSTFTMPRGKKDVEEDRFYQVYRYKKWPQLSSAPAILDTLRLHIKNHYDVIFVGHVMSISALGVFILRKLTGVPYVVLSHGNDLTYSANTRIDRWAMKIIMNNAKLILANSNFTQKRIRQLGFQGQVKVLNPGVDIKLFNSAINTDTIRKKYGLNGKKVLISVGRLVKRKNIRGVLQALPRIIQQFPNICYLIVGNGEERANLEKFSKENNLNAHVQFLGRIEDCFLPTLYAASDIFIMPSRSLDKGKDYEGFGMVYCEASACEIPVIAGRTGGTSDAVIDDETGLLIDANNVEEIAASVIRLLSDKKLAKRLGVNGRKRVEEEFGWEKIAEKLNSYLYAVCKKNNNLLK